MAQIKVTQTKSPVSLPKDQGRTLKALGLHRMRDTVEHTDSPSVWGWSTRSVTWSPSKSSRSSK